jgi:serine/threonine protein kinase
LLKKSRANNCLSEEECRFVLRKLISGLKDLYDFDIVHRDLKLANILLHFPEKIGEYDLLEIMID